MLARDLFENKLHDAYSVFQQLAGAVHSSKDIDLHIGHEIMPLQYWQARHLLGQYKSIAKRQGPDAAMAFLGDYNAINDALDAMDAKLAAMKTASSLPGQRGVDEGNLNEFDPSGFNGGGDGENERSRRIRKLLEIAIQVAKQKNVDELGMIHAMNMIAGDDFFNVAVEGILPDITDKEYMFVLQSAYKTVKQGLAEGYDEDDDNECYTCRGTGEGQFDGTSCSACGGSGIARPKHDDDEDFDIPDDYDMDEGAPDPRHLQLSLIHI